jgi:hypothetical protein
LVKDAADLGAVELSAGAPVGGAMTAEGTVGVVYHTARAIGGATFVACMSTGRSMRRRSGHERAARIPSPPKGHLP